MKQEINEDLRRELVEKISTWRLWNDDTIKQAEITREILVLLEKMSII